MTPGVRRYFTRRDLERARAAHGDFHPVTFAAYGRAFVAWDGRIKPPRMPELSASFTMSARIALCSAYTTAQLRAYGEAGHDNRAQRKARRRREAPRPRSILQRLREQVAA